MLLTLQGALHYLSHLILLMGKGRLREVKRLTRTSYWFVNGRSILFQILAHSLSVSPFCKVCACVCVCACVYVHLGMNGIVVSNRIIQV